MADLCSHTNTAFSEFLNRALAHVVAAALLAGCSFCMASYLNNPPTPPRLPPIEVCTKLFQELNIFHAREER
jgi:hypothetical protein